MPHRLPDNIVQTPGLLRYAIQDAKEDGGDGRHFLVLQLSDGKLLVHNPISPGLPPQQLIFATDLLPALNKELHHDGAWFMIFTHPNPEVDERTAEVSFEYARFAMVWMDQDGDPKFLVDWLKGANSEELDFADVLAEGLDAWLNKAEGAWQQFDYLMNDVLDPQEGETYKLAQGERPPTFDGGRANFFTRQFGQMKH